jgi:hypothetical protein
METVLAFVGFEIVQNNVRLHINATKDYNMCLGKMDFTPEMSK